MNLEFVTVEKQKRTQIVNFCVLPDAKSILLKPRLFRIFRLLPHQLNTVSQSVYQGLPVKLWRSQAI